MDYKAIAGAASTTASDALMNPFDGASAQIYIKHLIHALRFPEYYSDKATNANAQFRLPIALALREHGVPK